MLFFDYIFLRLALRRKESYDFVSFILYCRIKQFSFKKIEIDVEVQKGKNKFWEMNILLELLEYFFIVSNAH